MFAYAVCVLGYPYQKRVPVLLELELQRVQSHHVGPGNLTQAILTSEPSGILNCSVGGRDELSWHRKVWVDPL